ncbi:MAG: sigma-70 family RNA polymerase sigma factor [Gammaproteobacteria bacterium]|nr:sigma-70 family RNA polymerase sigma factor [Gammaproteobacteria bacterium]
MWEIFTQSRKSRQKLESRWHRLYRLAYSWCHDPDLAGDLTQDTLAKALKNMHQLKDTDALDAWLFSILNNCWKDYWRNRREMSDLDQIEHEPFDDIHTHQQRNDLISGVRQAIARLPLHQRQVLSLVDIEEMSYKEVAQILDIPIGTVMSRLCRARKELKDILITMERETVSNKPELRIIK